MKNFVRRRVDNSPINFDLPKEVSLVLLLHLLLPLAVLKDFIESSRDLVGPLVDSGSVWEVLVLGFSIFVLPQKLLPSSVGLLRSQISMSLLLLHSHRGFILHDLFGQRVDRWPESGTFKSLVLLHLLDLPDPLELLVVVSSLVMHELFDRSGVSTLALELLLHSLKLLHFFVHSVFLKVVLVFFPSPGVLVQPLLQGASSVCGFRGHTTFILPWRLRCFPLFK